jgi:hypothetical protein
MNRNVNPKTLKGQDKLNRMLDLMGKMSTLNESKSFSELELIKRGPNGIVYGIVRENHNYFIKTSKKPYGQFLAENFDYIGGLQNKNDERYNSYAEALKHLNIKFDMLNESYGIKNNTNIFESDGNAIAGGVGFGFVLEKEEELISDQKKVLKVDAPKSEEPATTSEPVEDEVSDDEFAMDDTSTTEEDPFADDTDTTDDTETTGEEGTEDLGDDDTTKKIQKLTGKIGQMLRDMEEADPKLEKYVVNSIISALHLDEMDETDKEDIIAKFEGEDDEDSLGSDSGEDVLDLDSDETSSETAPEEGDETSSETAPEEGGGELSEGRKVFSKKQLLESFLRKSTKKSLNKVLREHDNTTYRSYGKYDRNEYMIEDDENHNINEKLYGNQKRIDKNRNNRIDAEDFKMLRRGRSERRHIEEEEMDVMDAIQTGQGYLSATGDLDRDFDGIPNRLDLDNNDDGNLDFSMNSSDRYSNNRNSSKDDFIELDIDFLRNNGPGTKEKERTTTKPGTKPGTGTDWDRIKRPKADPKPKAMGDEERIRPSYRRRGMFR